MKTNLESATKIGEESFPKPTENLCLEKGAEWLSRYELIAKQPFFKGLSRRHLEILTEQAMIMRFDQGTQIIREGEPANRFFVILEGKVRLEIESGESACVSLCEVGPGEDLGWSWLLPDQYFQFSAWAVEPTKAIFFYGTRLRSLCESDYELGYEHMRRVASVMALRLDSMRRALLKGGL